MRCEQTIGRHAWWQSHARRLTTARLSVVVLLRTDEPFASPDQLTHARSKLVRGLLALGWQEWRPPGASPLAMYLRPTTPISERGVPTLRQLGFRRDSRAIVARLESLGGTVRSGYFVVDDRSTIRGVAVMDLGDLTCTVSGDFDCVAVGSSSLWADETVHGCSRWRHFIPTLEHEYDDVAVVKKIRTLPLDRRHAIEAALLRDRQAT